MIKVKIGLNFKILVPIFVLLLSTFGIGSFWAYRSAQTEIMDDNLEIVRESKERFSEIESQDKRALETVLRSLLGNKQIKTDYLSGNKENLYSNNKLLFDELKNSYGITHWYFINLADQIFLRMHDKSLSGDTVKRATYLKSKSVNGVGAGIELGKTAFALRVVLPYYDGGKLIGYMELGEEIVHFLNQMTNDTGARYSMVVKKELLKHEDWTSLRAKSGLSDNWDEYKDYVLISTNTLQGSAEEQSIKEHLVMGHFDLSSPDLEEEVLGSYKAGNKVYSVGAFRIKDASGKDAGIVYTSMDSTEAVKAANNGIFEILVLVSVLGASFFIIVTFFLQRNIISPIKKMSGATSELKNNGYHYTVKIRSKDEVGLLSNEIGDMTEKVRMSNENLEKEIASKTKKLDEKVTQLEKTNSIMVGRELRMMDLKKTIAKLENKRRMIDEDKK